MDYSCVIYISGFNNQKELVVFLMSLTKGILKGETLVVSDFVEIDIDENEEFDDIKEKEFPDGFLFFPFRLDLEFNENVCKQDCIKFTNILLKLFWSKNKSAVSACDYENQLINKGGYKSEEVPFP